MYLISLPENQGTESATDLAMGVVALAFNPSTREAEAEISLDLCEFKSKQSRAVVVETFKSSTWDPMLLLPVPGKHTCL